MNDIAKANEAAASRQLQQLVPEWRRLRLEAARAEKRVLEVSRVLATARGVAFIRLEQIEAEFGKENDHASSTSA